MKKVLFSVAVLAAVTLASCGGPDACECKTQSEELGKKIMENPKDAESIKKELEALKEKCKDFKDADYEKCK